MYLKIVMDMQKCGSKNHYCNTFYDEGKYEHPKSQTIGKWWGKFWYSDKMKCDIDTKNSVEKNYWMKWGSNSVVNWENVTNCYTYNVLDSYQALCWTSRLLPTITGRLLWLLGHQKVNVVPEGTQPARSEAKCQVYQTNAKESAFLIAKLHQMYILRHTPSSTVTKMKAKPQKLHSWRVTCKRILSTVCLKVLT